MMVAPTLASRQQAIDQAKRILAQNPVYLDTETTGLGITDEIVEISIVDDAGSTLFNSLVRPKQPIPAAAQAIHHISNEEVQKALPWPIVWQQVRPFLLGKVIIAYNSDFDQRMLKQSYTLYRLPWNETLDFQDLLKLYSQWRGEWDPFRRSWKFFSLSNAGKAANIPLPNTHRSTADSLLARALLHYLAAQTVE